MPKEKIVLWRVNFTDITIKYSMQNSQNKNPKPHSVIVPKSKSDISRCAVPMLIVLPYLDIY